MKIKKSQLNLIIRKLLEERYQYKVDRDEKIDPVKIFEKMLPGIYEALVENADFYAKDMKLDLWNSFSGLLNPSLPDVESGYNFLSKYLKSKYGSDSKSTFKNMNDEATKAFSDVLKKFTIEDISKIFNFNAIFSSHLDASESKHKASKKDYKSSSVSPAAKPIVDKFLEIFYKYYENSDLKEMIESERALPILSFKFFSDSLPDQKILGVKENFKNILTQFISSYLRLDLANLLKGYKFKNLESLASYAKKTLDKDMYMQTFGEELQDEFMMIHYPFAFASLGSSGIVSENTFSRLTAFLQKANIKGSNKSEIAGVVYSIYNDDELDDTIAKGLYGAGSMTVSTPAIGFLLDGEITGLFDHDIRSSIYSGAGFGNLGDEFERFVDDLSQKIDYSSKGKYEDPDVVYDRSADKVGVAVELPKSKDQKDTRRFAADPTKLKQFSKQLASRGYTEGFIRNWEVVGIIGRWGEIKDIVDKNISYDPSKPAFSAKDLDIEGESRVDSLERAVKEKGDESVAGAIASDILSQEYRGDFVGTSKKLATQKGQAEYRRKMFYLSLEDQNFILNKLKGLTVFDEKFNEVSSDASAYLKKLFPGVFTGVDDSKAISENKIRITKRQLIKIIKECMLNNENN